MVTDSEFGFVQDNSHQNRTLDILKYKKRKAPKTLKEPIFKAPIFCLVFLHAPDFSIPVSGCSILLGFYQVPAFSSENHWEIFFITWALLLVLDMLNEDCQMSLSDAKVGVFSINLRVNDTFDFIFSSTHLIPTWNTIWSVIHMV